TRAEAAKEYTAGGAAAAAAMAAHKDKNKVELDENGKPKSTNAKTGLSKDVIKDLDVIDAGTAKQLVGPAAKTASITAVAQAAGGKLPSNVTAVDAIRYKAYGLVDMDTEKVKSILALEELIGKDVTANNGTVRWNGTPYEVRQKMATFFGVS